MIDSIKIIVSRKSKADVYKRITELWEKKRMAEFAVANAQLGRAQDALATAQEQLEESQKLVRDQVLAQKVSGAELSMLSEALRTGKTSVDSASKAVNELEGPANEARDALVKSSQKRKVAEKLAKRRQDALRRERERRLERMLEDMTAVRASVPD